MSVVRGALIGLSVVMVSCATDYVAAIGSDTAELAVVAEELSNGPVTARLCIDAGGWKELPKFGRGLYKLPSTLSDEKPIPYPERIATRVGTHSKVKLHVRAHPAAVSGTGVGPYVIRTCSVVVEFQPRKSGQYEAKWVDMANRCGIDLYEFNTSTSGSWGPVATSPASDDC